VGNGLKAADLTEILYQDLFVGLDPSHVMVRNLQKHAVKRSIELLDDEETSVEIKGLMLDFQQKLLTFFRKKSKNAEVKAHNQFCRYLLEKHKQQSN
jgi:hypothetical protein